MEELIEVILHREQQLPDDDKSSQTASDLICADFLNDDKTPNTNAVRRRSRVQQSVPWKRKRQRNALLRERGQSYYGVKTIVDEEGRKWCKEVPRGGRKMKARCECKSPAFECKKVGDEVRQRLFDEFWALSWQEKRTYMSRLVVLGGVMRPRNRKNASFSRRSKSLKYYFEADGLRYRVCKTMFLNTFDLSQWSVHGWPKKWSKATDADNQTAFADVDCLLDESVDATDSWFGEFIARLPEQVDCDSSPQKHKSGSSSTDSHTVDENISEWISESEGENETVGSTTIPFVDVSAVSCDSDEENIDSVHEGTKYCKRETTTQSTDLTSHQADLQQMLLDMSRRMDEMQEKFDKRLQSLESQLLEMLQNKHRESATRDTKFSPSLSLRVDGEEQEADSLTEPQSDVSPNPKAKTILSHITSHVQNCYLTSCEVCHKLRRISEKIEAKPSLDKNSSMSDRNCCDRRIAVTRKLSAQSSTNNSILQCGYCLRVYDNANQLRLHLTRRHGVDE